MKSKYLKIIPTLSPLCYSLALVGDKIEEQVFLRIPTNTTLLCNKAKDKI